MTPLDLSADHARRFLLRRQLLDPPRSLPPGPESVLTAVGRLGSLQFDPLEAPGAKNHDLVLHARIEGYARAFCDALLYAPPGERRLFEAYNKSLNILPVEELPYYRIAWDRAEERYRTRIFADRAEGVAAVLGRLRQEGALSTAAFAHMGERVEWHWAPTAEGRAVLEALFECGRVGIARRDGSRRTFDLMDRLFPAELLERRVPLSEARRHKLLSRYRGVGLMGEVASAELTHGAGAAEDRARITAALVAEGVLVPARVEGVRGIRYLLAEERPILEATAKKRKGKPLVSFIAPLDPLLWDRRLVRELFGFAYVWEVYTPEARRQHGYYVLPILFGDRLVGRIEPRFERKTGVLSILSVRFEEGFDALAAPGFTAAFGEALSAYAGFVGAKKVTWPRGKVAAALGRAFTLPEARAASPGAPSSSPRGSRAGRRRSGLSS